MYNHHWLGTIETLAHTDYLKKINIRSVGQTYCQNPVKRLEYSLDIPKYQFQTITNTKMEFTTQTNSSSRKSKSNNVHAQLYDLE